tara:strand:+ start:250 stop:1317 length:1068 start_codon:yes stop_codon:yes gene_type:complete
MSSEQETIIKSDKIKSFAIEALKSTSMSDEDAKTIADTLVESDLKGVYSHGIQLLPRYVRGLENGINPKPDIKIITDSGTIATLDGDCGMGQVVSVTAMKLAIKKAKKHGTGIVVARNSNHLGALAYYGMMAASENMISMCTTNAAAIMAPWGGTTETLGNNPICWTIPGDDTNLIMLDMAVSTAARNKIRVAAAKGEQLPRDWAFDKDGQPTQDPQKALDGLIAPMAGPKGFGLAVIMEILSGVLAQGLIGKELPRDAITSTDIFYPTKTSHYFHVIDISKFCAVETFKQRVKELSAQIHESNLAKGTSQIFMPGEIEFQTRAKRLNEGIPISKAVLINLEKLAKELNLSGLKN